jgi:uncharacterized membrane protein YidH (DUF202 family)
MIFKIKHVWNKIRLYLSFLLFAFYLVIGFLLLFSDIWSNFLIKGREIIGLALVLFGVLRFYIAYRRYKNKHKHIKIQFIKKKKQLIKELQNDKTV